MPRRRAASAPAFTVRDERRVAGGRLAIVELETPAERVPAVHLVPEGEGPWPAALLLHGLRAHKGTMADSIGRALLAHGIASLAPDLPVHGERERMNQEAMRRPMELLRRWRMAEDEARLALDWLATREAHDPDCLAVAGYSLGSYLGVEIAARDARVRAVVLAAGGDLPAATPFAALVRRVVNPTAAVKRLAGRPLLMVNGRRDRTITPDQAERLFAAAREPKTLRWWDAGHYLPTAAIDEGAAWLADALGRPESPRPQGSR